MSTETLVLLVIFGGINHQITHIITTGVLFEGGRGLIQRHCWPKIGYLVTCHLCCGTWVGFFMALVLTPEVTLSANALVNWGALAFSVSVLGRLWNEALSVLSSKVSELRSRQECGC